MPANRPGAGFYENTRWYSTELPAIAKPTGGGVTTQILPSVGFLQGLFLDITATVSGTVTTPNPLGVPSIVRRVSLYTGGGLRLIDVSGVGYHNLLRRHLETGYIDVVPKATAPNTAISAATFDLSMWFPIAPNIRDAVSLLNLQNKDMVFTLSVEWEADSTIVSAGGATTAATCVPMIDLFTVPPSVQDYPPQSLIQTFLEETRSVTTGGDFVYPLLLDNIYTQILLGYGIAASPADSWTAVKLRVQQSEFLFNYSSPRRLDARWGMMHGVARPLGVIPFDFMGSSGLGNYGSMRDYIDTDKLTDLAIVLTPSASTTLYAIRRQFVRIKRRATPAPAA